VRLAIVRQHYQPQGPAERFLEAALEALLERNVAITLYTREWPQTKLQLIEPHICDPFYLGPLWRDWGFAREVTRAIVTTRANLVQSHELVQTCDIYRPAGGIHATWLEERLRDASPALRLRVALSPWHRYMLAMERKLFASPWLRAVLCNSKMVRDDIKARFGLPDERLPVLYNAVDANAYSPALREHRERIRKRYKIADDAVVFLLVGSGYGRKGVPAAIAALAELPAATHLLIVGEDRRLGTYKRLAREQDVRERVTFAGYQADVAPYYGAADAFVLPTIYDSFPDAAMEALASGLPVVTSTRSGAAELVAEHDAGFVCDARDTAALAAHLRTLLDPAVRERLGVNARNAVLPLSPAAMTLKLVLLYKELLEASIAHKQAARAAAAASAVATPSAPAETPPLHGEFGLDSETLPGADTNLPPHRPPVSPPPGYPPERSPDAPPDTPPDTPSR
jgi:UDP-glucose:(heptosyl)LPS alpha-1,3-glucosyltransferase